MNGVRQRHVMLKAVWNNEAGIGYNKVTHGEETRM